MKELRKRKNATFSSRDDGGLVQYGISRTNGILRFQLGRKPAGVPSPTVFLDRDGVLNRRIVGGYVTCWDDFELLPGVVEALALLGKIGFQTAIVSNQAAVAKGLLGWETLADITARSLQQFHAGGGQIDGAFFCLHQPSDQCGCRKPKPGLLLEAARCLPVDFSRSFLIGDSEADMLAGAAAGCKTVYLAPALSSRVTATHQARTLDEAVRWIRRQSGL